MRTRGLAATILGAAVTIACGGSSSSPTAAPTPAATPTPAVSAPVVLDATNFAALVLASGRPCLVEFQLPTCPHCQAMIPIVTQLATDFDARALVGTVDASQQGALTRSYGVSSVPTFVFFKHGGEVSRQVGETSYGDLAAKLTALIAAP